MREPVENGMIFRAPEIPPDMKDKNLPLVCPLIMDAIAGALLGARDGAVGLMSY
jgi:hypothetical protein